MPERPHSARKNVIFLHLPKTAGSTINFILERQYPPEVFYAIKGPPFPALKKFEQLSLETRAKIRVMKGHGEYGMHKFLQGDTQYFTFLRNPIDRAISEYYYLLRTPETPYYPYVTQNNLSLKDVVECKNPLITMDNAQTIILAGAWRENIEECTNEILDRAKRNLREHFIVGLTEKFDASLCLLKSSLHWENYIVYRKINVTQNRPTQEMISKDALDAIVQANQYDLQLYRYGQTLFAEQMREKGYLFPAKVRFFKLFNKAHEYEWFLTLLHFWHKFKGKI